jgi:hypothetical protein
MNPSALSLFWENFFPSRVFSQPESRLKNLQNQIFAIAVGFFTVWHQNCSFPLTGTSGGAKNAIDIGSSFVVFIEGSVSAAMAAGGQIADLESEVRVLRKGDRL